MHSFSLLRSAGYCLLAACMLPACQSSEIGFAKDVNPETIFQEYLINYDEGEELVRCRALLRFAGDKGTTLVLGPGGTIKLDGQAVLVDSAAGVGAYYEIEMPVKSFLGQHCWEYQSEDGKAYKNCFSFDEIGINAPNDIVAGDSLILGVTGLHNGEEISLVMSDAASQGYGLDSTFIIQGGKVVVPATYFQAYPPGILTLQARYFKSIPLRQHTREGGALAYNYDFRPVEVRKGITN